MLRNKPLIIIEGVEKYLKLIEESRNKILEIKKMNYE